MKKTKRLPVIRVACVSCPWSLLTRNWGGMPLIGGNTGGTKEQRGNLTQLKRAGLIWTVTDETGTWLGFTAAGREFAAANGIDLSWIEEAR